MLSDPLPRSSKEELPVNADLSVSNQPDGPLGSSPLKLWRDCRTSVLPAKSFFSERECVQTVSPRKKVLGHQRTRIFISVQASDKVIDGFDVLAWG